MPDRAADITGVGRGKSIGRTARLCGIRRYGRSEQYGRVGHVSTFGFAARHIASEAV